MKRKSLSLILVVLLIFSIMPTAFASDDVRVTLDGRQLVFDVPPQIVDGRTLVPLRAIFEALGADIDWNPDTRTVTATRDDVEIVMQVGNVNMTVDGRNVILDVAPVIVDGRTLVPARAVAESFGVGVDWNATTRTVILTTTPGAGVTAPGAVTVTREGLTDPANYWFELDGVRYYLGMTVTQFMDLGLQIQDRTVETLDRSIGSFGTMTGFTFSWHDGDIWRWGMSVVLRNTGNDPVLVRNAKVGSMALDINTARGFDSVVFINGIELGVTTPEDIIAMFGEPTERYDADLFITLHYRPFFNDRDAARRNLMFAGYTFTFDPRNNNTLNRVNIDFLEFERP